MKKSLDFSQFTTVKALENFADSQQERIAALQKDLEEKNFKIAHLEQLLETAGGKAPVASNELELCKLEIARLYHKAKDFPLEDKDVRNFDVYVKNLLAIQNKVVPDKAKKKEPTLSPEELIKVALQNMPDTDEQ